MLRVGWGWAMCLKGGGTSTNHSASGIADNYYTIFLPTACDPVVGWFCLISFNVLESSLRG